MAPNLRLDERESEGERSKLLFLSGEVFLSLGEELGDWLWLFAISSLGGLRLVDGGLEGWQEEGGCILSD